MTLVASPQGPVVLDHNLEVAMRTTGYVSSVNGLQGAVHIDFEVLGGAELLDAVFANPITLP